jgi:hypothetical protein
MPSMQSRQELLIQYFENEQEDRGVPLLLLIYDAEATNAPYLQCLSLAKADGTGELPGGLDEYLRAVLSDIREASDQSQEAARLLFARLEGSIFGPLRGKRV